MVGREEGTSGHYEAARIRTKDWSKALEDLFVQGLGCTDSQIGYVGE